MKGLILEFHVDCDNLWSYGKEFQFDSQNGNIYDEAVQNFEEIFLRYGAKAKFFVVGKDLSNLKNRRVVERISKNYEIGNHTHNHLSNFGRISLKEAIEEIRFAHNSIKSVTGLKVDSFKSPGYSFRTDIHDFLVFELGYKFDCSPTSKFSVNLLNLIAKLIKMNKEFYSPDYVKVKKDYPIGIISHLNYKHTKLIANSTTFMKMGFNKKIKSIIETDTVNKAFTFHAIDLYPDNHKMSKVPTLRVPFQKRVNMVTNIVENFLK